MQFLTYDEYINSICGMVSKTIPSFHMYLLENENEDNFKIDVDTKSDTSIVELNINGSIQKFKLDGSKIYLVNDKDDKEEIKDKNLIKYIRQHVKSGIKIKDKSKHEFIDRVVANIDDELEDKLNDDIEGKSDNEHKDSIDINIGNSFQNIVGNLGEGDGIIVDLKDLGLSLKVIQKWFNPKKIHRIGKGEFLLPILYNDVEKTDLNSESKGDDVLVSGESNNPIEVKTAGAPFNVYDEHCIPDTEEDRKTDEYNILGYCLYGLAKYLKTRNLGVGKTLYLVLFNNKFTNSYQKINDDLTDEQKDDAENENDNSNISKMFILNCGDTFRNGKDKTNRIEKLGIALRKYASLSRYENIVNGGFQISGENMGDDCDKNTITIFINNNIIKNGYDYIRNNIISDYFEGSVKDVKNEIDELTKNITGEKNSVIKVKTLNTVFQKMEIKDKNKLTIRDLAFICGIKSFKFGSGVKTDEIFVNSNLYNRNGEG